MPENEIEAKKPADKAAPPEPPIGGGLVGLIGERKTSTEVAGVKIDIPFVRNPETYSTTMGILSTGSALFQNKYAAYHAADFAANKAAGFVQTGMSTTTLRAAGRDLGFVLAGQAINYGLDKTVFADVPRTWRSLAVDVGSIALVAVPKGTIEVKTAVMVGTHIAGRFWDSTVPPEAPVPAKPAKDDFDFDSSKYIK